jgi:hypothetical protein
MATQLSLPQLFWTSLLWICVLADKIVYLDRPGHYHSGGNTIMSEPFFNPNSISANIGEQIQFVAQFKDLTSLSGRNVLPSNPSADNDYRPSTPLTGLLQSLIILHRAFITEVNHSSKFTNVRNLLW